MDYVTDFSWFSWTNILLIFLEVIKTGKAFGPIIEKINSLRKSFSY